MTYILTDPPQAEPLTLAEMKAHMRLDGDEEDALLTSLIKTAREHLERETGLCLITQGWRLLLDAWPQSGAVTITKGPVRNIDAIQVYDFDGEPEDISSPDQLLDGQARPARLWLRNPQLPGRPINGIEIDFRAGYGDTPTEVPDTLKRAMSLHVAHMFAFRGVVTPEQQPAGVPAGYERLIAPFCRRGL